MRRNADFIQHRDAECCDVFTIADAVYKNVARLLRHQRRLTERYAAVANVLGDEIVNHFHLFFVGKICSSLKKLFYLFFDFK
jgi:hypothetical protein